MYFDLQKASMLKRISALILDIIVISILATGFGSLVSSLIGYDDRLDRYLAMQERYEREYNVSAEVTAEEWNAMGDEERARFEQAQAAMNEDPELKNGYMLVFNMTLVILTISFLLAFTVNDIVVPLIFKNGQTVGKKVFDLAVMQTDHTKLRTPSLVARTILGKCTIETLVPVLICFMIFYGFIGIVGTIAMIILLLLQLVALIRTETNSAIHDLLASTVVVDMKSQMIFEDAQQMEVYKQKLEEKEIEKRAL